MLVIEIESIPNQEFSTTIGGDRWDFILKQAVTSMAATISLNDQVILSGQRIVAGTPIIPYKYLQSHGNFLITTVNDQIPTWERFGVDQFLTYASAEEIASL